MRFLYSFTAIVLLLIFLLPYAASETIALRAGHSKTISGKNISLIAAYSDFVTVDVDGVQKDIKVFVVQNGSEVKFNSRTTMINGVNITVNDVFESQESAELIIEIAFVCGDGSCSSAETQATCCKDCACSSGYTCTDNQCIESKLNECTAAADCNDSKSCTIDLCEGIPRKCYNMEITLCTDNDNCCLEKCYYENDSDCPRSKTKLECFSSRDCIDSDVCTTDYCENGKCAHNKSNGCSLNQTCMPISSVETINGTGSYCAAAGWQKQKKSNQACTENFECQGNVCEQGKCKGGKEKSAEGNRNLLLFLSIAAVFIIAIILLLVSRLKKR